jgi:hypothetical protein
LANRRRGLLTTKFNSNGKCFQELMSFWKHFLFHKYYLVNGWHDSCMKSHWCMNSHRTTSKQGN